MSKTEKVLFLRANVLIPMKSQNSNVISNGDFKSAQISKQDKYLCLIIYSENNFTKIWNFYWSRITTTCTVITIAGMQMHELREQVLSRKRANFNEQNVQASRNTTCKFREQGAKCDNINVKYTVIRKWRIIYVSYNKYAENFFSKFIRKIPWSDLLQCSYYKEILLHGFVALKHLKMLNRKKY